LEVDETKIKKLNKRNIPIGIRFWLIFIIVMFTVNPIIILEDVEPAYIRQPKFVIRDFSSVDNDSNIDSIVNVGTNDSDYSNTASLDNLQQNITEALVTPDFEIQHTKTTHTKYPDPIKQLIQ
jgi:hypothetical protein